MLPRGGGAAAAEAAEDGCGVRLPIASVDVSPDGARLATGGDDGYARVWSVAALRRAEDDPAVAASDDAAASAASADDGLRERMRGRMLAKLRHDNEVSSVRWCPADAALLATATDAGQVVVARRARLADGAETYPVVWAVAAHPRNVTDIAWAPDGVLLASASVSSRVVVLDAAHGGCVVASVELDGAAKGLAWDPQGVYVVAQVEGARPSVAVIRVGSWNVVKTVSEHFFEPEMRFFRRPSWSPDGEFVVAAAARGKYGGVERSIAIELRNGVWTPNCDFMASSSVIVARYGPLCFKEGFYSPVALGCSNGDVAAVRSRSAHPLFSIKKLFSGEVQDMVWTRDGAIIACARDGRVLLLQIPESVLGRICTEEEKAQHMLHVHGDALGYVPPAFAHDIPESAAQWQAEQQTSAAVAAAATAADAASSAPRALLAPIAVHSTVSQHATVPMDTTTILSMQKVTMGRGGKKRIAPVVQAAVIEASPSPVSAVTHVPSTNSVLPPPPQPPPPSAPAEQSVHKQQQQQQQQQPERTKTESHKRHHPKEKKRAKTSKKEHASDEAEEDADESVPKAPVVVSRALPMIGPMAVLEAKNDEKSTTSQISLRLGEGTRKHNSGWISPAVRGCITHLAGSPSFCAAACADGSLLLFSFDCGSSLAPQIAIGAPVLLMEAHGDFLAIVTKRARFSLWNIRTMESMVLDAAIDRSMSIEDLDLTISAAGVPVLTTPARQAAFSRRLGVWISAPRSGVGKAKPQLFDVEQQLAFAQLVGSKEEYDVLLVTYARLLAEGCHEGRIRTLYHRIEEDPEHAGMASRVLEIISATNRNLQRLVQELRSMTEALAPGARSKPAVGMP